jgi:NAD(P)-dependent dehydrogenase (short-subunit alcohol dehydrogenase family)
MNRSVFITGGTANTGLGVAEKFAREGYNVFVSSRTKESAQKTAQYLTLKYGVVSKGYETIINDEQNVIEIFNDIEKNGYLVECVVLVAADLGIGQEFFTVDIEDFATVINTNIIWNFMIARAAARHMIKLGKGSIVFVNSNTAYRIIPDRIAYSTSKSGALGMMRALAFDLGKYNIRVNAVLPGMIKTDRWETNYNNCRSALSNYTPLGDIATIEDIANAVWYFGSDNSLNTTGAELVVDGGNSIQLYPIVPEK